MPRQLPPVDDDIYEYLVKQAVPLEDDVNTLLRRLLRLPGGRNAPPADSPQAERMPANRRRPNRKAPVATKRSRAAKGSILAEEEYQLPILRAIAELGGRAPSSEVVDRVGKLLEPRMSNIDRETISSGEARWRNRAQFVRLALIRSGDMKSGSPRGIWELSDQGHTRLREAQ